MSLFIFYVSNDILKLVTVSHLYPLLVLFILLKLCKTLRVFISLLMRMYYHFSSSGRVPILYVKREMKYYSLTPLRTHAHTPGARVRIPGAARQMGKPLNVHLAPVHLHSNK